MRNITACLLFAFLNVVLAPSSQELHTRYGEPNSERFMARPGIAVSVEYGADGAACSVLIEPPRAALAPRRERSTDAVRYGDGHSRRNRASWNSWTGCSNRDFR